MKNYSESDLMNRNIDNCNTTILLRLLEKIYQGINSMINDYKYLYSDRELDLLLKVLNDVKMVINEISNDHIDKNDIKRILCYEELLKPYSFRTWMSEHDNGSQYVSWFKTDTLGDMPSVLSTTFGDTDSFCFSRCGISYEVDLEGFLGACSKDAATVVEKNSKQSIYTIGFDKNENVINSYNFATPLMTPKLVCDSSDNDYMSKHNEIILDSRYVKPVSVIYTSENDIEFVSMISKKLNIPLEYKKTSHTR